MLEIQPYQITLDISLSLFLFPTYEYTLKTSVKHLHSFKDLIDNCDSMHALQAL